MRGFSVILLEKGELGSGASGHFHGMLHSGARYVVDDPETALTCLRENRILRKIAGPSINDTGGYFIALDNQDVDYAGKLLAACGQVDIPVSEVDVALMQKREPALTPRIKRALHVPDGAVDSKILIRLNRLAAGRADAPALFLTNHEVTGFHRSAGRINAVIAKDAHNQRLTTINCNYVINAAGVWANNISRLAEITIELVWDKGTMVVLERNLTRSVINRCRPQADGDIIVPVNGHSVVGTTSVRTDNIDRPSPTEKEIERLMRQAQEMIPELDQVSIKTTYAGVRPLLGKGSSDSQNRKISRCFRVIDHAEHGVENFISIVGGKLTVYRRMAEVAIDLICKKENVDVRSPIEVLQVSESELDAVA
jgi:glycerol-3-phosphate dehydrogenase